ncbi:hypothetical protein KM043_010817 [Ampulex compressa]|nr:hypothetical protein KM043_010817 [Ampulex compressa]
MKTRKRGATNVVIANDVEKVGLLDVTEETPLASSRHLGELFDKTQRRRSPGSFSELRNEGSSDYRQKEFVEMESIEDTAVEWIKVQGLDTGISSSSSCAPKLNWVGESRRERFASRTVDEYRIANLWTYTDKDFTPISFSFRHPSNSSWPGGTPG